MTITNYPNQSLLIFLEECIKISANSMTMYSKYWLSYTQTIFRLIDSMNPANHAKLTANRNNGYFTPHTFLSDFINVSNSEIKKQLCSKDFLQSFQDYIKSNANLDVFQKQIFSNSLFSYQDKLIDEYLKLYNNNLASINQTPHKVIVQVNGTRLLHYYSPQELISKICHPFTYCICSN